MTFHLAYLRLTLFYVLIVMSISIGFSAVIYQVSTNELGRGLDRQSRFFRGLPLPANQNTIPDNIEQLRAAQLDESSGNIRTDLMYFNLLILLLAGFGSYFLAKKTMSPLEEAMETQNRFTADASHELRTPLTAMKSEIEVNLRDDSLDLSRAKKLLKSNLEEIGKLEALSGALLQLARSQNDMSKSFLPIMLEDVVTEAYERVEKIADRESISFVNNFINVSVLGDKKSLVELFVILLDNAIKYSPRKSKIYITIAKEKHSAIVKIKDSGCGIDTKDIPHIFERFYRADTSRCKTFIEGYGLGLSIAKQIVVLNNGKISVTSTPGKGSEFAVEFGLEKISRLS